MPFANSCRDNDEAWKQATVTRRKFVNFAFTARHSLEGLRATYERSSASKFEGKSVTSHRVFILSADLYDEAPKKPWLSANHKINESICSTMVKFMLEQKSPVDVLVFADGRSKQSRAMLDNLTSAMRHPSELWLLFTPSPRLPCGMRRCHSIVMCNATIVPKTIPT